MVKVKQDYRLFFKNFSIEQLHWLSAVKLCTFEASAENSIQPLI